ncbi:MAG: M48 family metallopeptidase [Candidatus Verstraetearchaeota archaeon]|nr:M48 family metallopeptidase [Candidatus Verstraetearchaeota archaeon]
MRLIRSSIEYTQGLKKSTDEEEAPAAEGFRERVRRIAHELLESRRLEVFGQLRFEVVDIEDLALIKGNRIYISMKAKDFPDGVLKYIIAHELAHLAVKRHTKRFWETVGMIYPGYKEHMEEMKRLLNKE